MKLVTKVGTLAAIGTIAIAMPAAAHSGGKSHGGKSHSGKSHGHHHGTGGGKSHKCQAHGRAYVESGTLDQTTPSTLAQNSDGTWSGTLVVDVVQANHAAKGDIGQTVPYTFSSSPLRVSFDGGATAITGGERVQLIGKLPFVGKKCPAPDQAPAPVFRHIVVEPASLYSES